MVLTLKLISKQVFKPIWQTLQLVLRFAKEFFNPVFFSHEDLKSFLEEDGLAQFEARVRAVQETDAYFARVSFYQDGEGQVHGVYHLAQGVKTVLPREPFVPTAYIEQLVIRKCSGDLTWFKSQETALKPEDYEAIARLDYANS